MANLCFLAKANAAASPEEKDVRAAYPIESRLPVRKLKKAFSENLKAKADLWSLPMNGPFAAKAKSFSIAETKQLEGGISVLDNENLVGQNIDELLDKALDKDDKTKALNKAVAHFNTPLAKVVAEGKDAAQYMIPYRGFAESSEAGDIIMDKSVKLKSRAAAEYARQKHIDEKHVQIVTSMSEIAMGLGLSDKTRGKVMVASGLKSLNELAGDEEANKSLTALKAFAQDLAVPEAVFTQGVWDVNTRQDKFKTLVEAALKNDPVILEITRHISKYNHHSKLSLAASHVVGASLGAASLTPSFIGPAAKSALLAYVMATGGPESSKIMKELYLDKRFESRWKVVDAEAHLALDNYHIAVLTHNPTLLAFSESLVGEMAGKDNIKKVLGTSVLSYAPEAGGLQAKAAD